MLHKKLEYRYRKIQELILQGVSQEEIAKILGITIQTVSSDLHTINRRYTKLVLENKDYLSRQLELIFRKVDELDLVKRKLYEIASAEESVGEFLAKLSQCDAKQKLEEIKLLVSKTRDKIQALNSIVNIIEKQAKLQKLIVPDVNFIQNNYLHIDKLDMIFEAFGKIIFDCVTPEKQVEALTRLKAIALDKKKDGT